MLDVEQRLTRGLGNELHSQCFNSEARTGNGTGSAVDFEPPRVHSGTRIGIHAQQGAAHHLEPGRRRSLDDGAFEQSRGPANLSIINPGYALHRKSPDGRRGRVTGGSYQRHQQGSVLESLHLNTPPVFRISQLHTTTHRDLVTILN
jgi:hypothetical protein